MSATRKERAKVMALFLNLLTALGEGTTGLEGIPDDVVLAMVDDIRAVVPIRHDGAATWTLDLDPLISGAVQLLAAISAGWGGAVGPQPWTSWRPCARAPDSARPRRTEFTVSRSGARLSGPD